MHFNTVRRSTSLIMVLISFILFGTFISVNGNEYWLSHKEIEYSGDKIFLYFTPEPGKVSMETEKVIGIINATSNNEDYSIRILVLAYGTIQDNETIYSNVAQLEIILDTSINAYTEEIELKIPENGNFTVYMDVDCYWYNDATVVYNETVSLAANYQKASTGFDLASILLPVGLLIISGSLLIFIGLIVRRFRSKSLDITLIEEKLEEIDRFIRPYFTKSGEFREIEKGGSLQKPGEISLIKHQRKSRQLMFEKLQPRINEMNEIRIRHEAAQEPVFNNPLFNIISSLFIQASEKYEYYPDTSNISNHVQEIRNSLQQGKWDLLNDVTKIKIAWEICEKYAKSLPSEKDLLEYPILDFDLEAIKLSGQIRNYLEAKREKPLPSDRNLILQSRDDLTRELELLDRLLENYKSINKKDLSQYAIECSSLKKEAESRLKYLKWLKNQNCIIDIDLLLRLADRTPKLIELITEEIRYINKIK
ncbi:MAG: hypothetical protein ACW97X_05625 [Candidatus Hodarchaeales archaeon]